MADQETQGKGSSGRTTTVTVDPPMLATAVISAGTVEESSLPSDQTFAQKVNHIGTNFTDKEKLLARFCFAKPTDRPVNLRRTFHIVVSTAGSGTAAKPTLTTFICTGVLKDNNEIDLIKVGAPTNSLPDSAAISAIDKRLNGFNISINGFSGDEDKAMKMSLNVLTDKELERMKDVKFSRGGASPGGDVGGRYVQASHTVEMFNEGMRLAGLLCLGPDPAKLLPNCSHVVFHEAAHVLAHLEVRQLEQKDQQAQRDVDAQRAHLRSTFPNNYTETAAADGSFSFTTTEAGLSAADKKTFKSDVSALETKMKAAEKTNKDFVGLKQTKMMKEFTTSAKGQATVTHYSRDEKVKADASKTDEDIRAAREEFMAEAFGIVKWDPAWLATNRAPVKGYFDGGKHLT
ncbi:MAG: hypothetical protein WBP29_13570 [Candidatus Zixiibacteriota bacterium]